jgi:hypothetical protein
MRFAEVITKITPSIILEEWHRYFLAQHFLQGSVLFSILDVL